MTRAGLISLAFSGVLAVLGWTPDAGAQTDDGFFVTPLEDLPDGGEGEGGTGFGLDAIGDQDIGSTDGGVFLQENPGGQSGVALIERPNTTAPQETFAPAALNGPSAFLRALDKTVGRPTDIEIAEGETVLFGRIAIRMIECRYPEENPASDAYAHLQIADTEGAVLFDGWMIASSPALMALEHSRYDVWVLRCSTS